MSAVPSHGIGYKGCHHEGYAGGGHHLPAGSCWTDIWGTMWQRLHPEVMGFPVKYPLADLPSALREYQWPDPDDERICGQIYEQARDWNRDESFLNGSHRDAIWEKSYMLVGMENMMCYFYTEPQAVRELLRRIMDFQLGIARHYLNAGAEMVEVGSDLGTQNRLLLSPEIISNFLVPEYRRLFNLYKRRNVLINFHSCGHIIPILDIFMDLGVDILNPVQAAANDLVRVRQETQGRMALQGGVSSVTIMNGPVEAIRKEVAVRLGQLGQDGGYFCGPDQSMPYPTEHIAAVYAAVEEYGRYPLQALFGAGRASINRRKDADN